MKRLSWLMLSVVGLALVSAGCGEGPAEAAPAGTEAKAEEKPWPPDEWPSVEDPLLQQGRAVWIENCENCHGIGKVGSPRFGDHEAWKPRLAKGEAELIQSALNGFEGTSEDGMPPRGGNDDLSDAEVTAAARYMIHFGKKENSL